MKYLYLLSLLVLSQFTNGQHVFTKFEKVMMFDDFSFASNRWEQKNNANEQFIISNNMYSVKRLKETYFAISLPIAGEEFADFELVTSIRLEEDKQNKDVSGGLIFRAQNTGSSALILEFNAKNQYRILVMENGQLNNLFGNIKDGWQKSKHLKSGAFNEIRLVTQGNEFDIYFNKRYERSFIETTFKSGRVGFYANARSGMAADYIIVRANTVQTSIKDDQTNDKTYTELATMFKNKIDQQQSDIDKLSRELNICKSSLTMDTTAISENKVLKKENVELNRRVSKIESELERATERLSYLESMKKDIESNTNGDLILNLTEMLSREKSKNEALNKENEKLKKDLKEIQQRY